MIPVGRIGQPVVPGAIEIVSTILHKRLLLLSRHFVHGCAQILGHMDQVEGQLLVHVGYMRHHYCAGTYAYSSDAIADNSDRNLNTSRHTSDTLNRPPSRRLLGSEIPSPHGPASPSIPPEEAVIPTALQNPPSMSASY